MADTALHHHCTMTYFPARSSVAEWSDVKYSLAGNIGVSGPQSLPPRFDQPSNTGMQSGGHDSVQQ